MKVYKLADFIGDTYEFENVMRSFVIKLGFIIESTDKLGDGTLEFITKTTNPAGGRITSLIRASPKAQSISISDIEDLYDSMVNNQAVRSAFITISSFTRDAEEYARDKPISLISKYQFIESVQKHGFSSDEEFMEILDRFGLGEHYFQSVEQAFKPSRSEREAMDFFKSKTGKKGLFGKKKEKDAAANVVLRYAPVAVFKVKMTKYVHTDTKEISMIEKREYMFVNLHNLDLYYILQKRKKNSVQLSFNKSDILAKIIHLPEDAKSYLMTLLEHGDLPLEDLEGVELSVLQNKKIINIYEGKKGATSVTDMATQALDGLLETINLAVDEITTGISSMGEESESSSKITEEKSLPKKVEAQINMPHTEGGLYDIWKHLDVERGIMHGSDIDSLIYSSKDIAALIGKVMDGKVEREGILFLPYYRARYVDSDTSRFTKYELLVTPKFKGTDKSRATRSDTEPKKDSVVKVPIKKSTQASKGMAGDFKLIK